MKVTLVDTPKPDVNIQLTHEEVSVLRQLVMEANWKISHPHHKFLWALMDALVDVYEDCDE